MSYTRNFEFRVHPKSGQRAGRYIAPATGTAIVIGAPVKVNTAAAANELGLPEVVLATGEQAPVAGQSGIAVYEYKGSEGWAGDDPYLTTYSDKATVPLGEALQVVSGDSVKVAFTNTVSQLFLNTRTYAGRVMVSQSGATPNIAVGEFLSPGVGNDTSGYWAKTTDRTKAWMVVTSVDSTRDCVEARLLF